MSLHTQEFSGIPSGCGFGPYSNGLLIIIIGAINFLDAAS